MHPFFVPTFALSTKGTTPPQPSRGREDGIDLFDCVMPSRNARHATVFTMRGIMHVTNQCFATDPRPIEEGCQCPTCKNFSRAYIRHLFKAGEQLAGRLAVQHNLWFYNNLMTQIRDNLDAGTFADFRAKYSDQLGKLYDGA